MLSFQRVLPPSVRKLPIRECLTRRHGFDDAIRGSDWGERSAPTRLPKCDPDKTSSGTTIEESVKAFLAKCERRGISGTHISQVQNFAKQFRAYCDGRGYVLTGQLLVGDGELFYATWKDGARAAGRKLERFRRMVKFWKKQGWIEHDLGVFDIDTPIGANEPAASTFDVNRRLDGNDIFIRAMKNGKRLYTWVPDCLRDILLDRQKRFRRQHISGWRERSTPDRNRAVATQVEPYF